VPVSQGPSHSIDRLRLVNRALPLTPELRLVFRSADPAATSDEQIAVARQVKEWARALTMAEMEGATPSLWRALQPHTAELPREVSEFLRMRTMISDFRMSQLSQRAQETVRALKAAGIPVLLLKGAAVGALSDPTFHARPMGDVDLFVHERDVERAVNALLDTGWSVTSDEVVVELLKGQHHLPHFVRADLPGLRLELHTMLLPPGHAFALDEAALWRDATPAPAPFEGALLLSPEHQALHASIHFAWQHRVHFGTWRTMRSLAVIVSQPGFSWERLEREARAVKAGTTVYWTLRLAFEMAGIPVPLEMLSRLAPPNPTWLMRGLERHFAAQIAAGEGPTSPSVRVTHSLWLMALRPRWSGLGSFASHSRGREWDRAYGRESKESSLQRVKRHLSNYHLWWAFLSRTILGR
jgi:hypothetical protein